MVDVQKLCERFLLHLDSKHSYRQADNPAIEGKGEVGLSPPRDASTTTLEW
jgi:hypothetical protein